MSEKMKNRQELEARIVAKAWADPAYRERLLADPKALLAEELQADYPELKLPEDLQVKVVEETPLEMTLVLPVNPQTLVGLEMSEAALGQVAGGFVVVVTTMPVVGPVVGAPVVGTVVGGPVVGPVVTPLFMPFPVVIG